MKEAMLYEKAENNKVRCKLCAHRCLISPESRGVCRVRVNQEGTLYTLAYGKAIAANIDPIEKKPLYHFLPGSYAFSIATAGCNFRCEFCQNWQISQFLRNHEKKGEDIHFPGEKLSPEQIVKTAINNNCKAIAYTYTEPTIFFEYAYDTAKIAQNEGLKNVFVTNGYQTPETIEKMTDLIDAANIDLKSFRNEYYQKVCGATLQPVLDSIKLMHEKNIWIEITTLVVPDQNDSEKELTNIAKFIAGVDKNTPWHISRFHPAGEMTNAHPTPLETMGKAAKIGEKAGLNFIYLGNTPNSDWENTICPQCGEVVISRRGYSTTSHLENNRCPQCNTKIPGIF
ncbi:MAG: AmmeMemoRadiSam system radical SAM enzyme [Patescibacteria group bacterium]